MADGSTWPRITIVTPSLNQGRFLEESIRSVLLQGYPNLEYIIMDAGSTDESCNIIDRYKSHFASWISETDDGQAAAIAAGFDKATGEIFAYLNSDDVYLPNTLSTVAELFEQYKSADWLIGASNVIDADGASLHIWMPPVTTYMTLSIVGCRFNQPSSFWRKRAYDQVGGFNRSLRFAFDYDLFLRLARHSSPLRTRKILAAFRNHQASKTSTMPAVAELESRLLSRQTAYGRCPTVCREAFRVLYGGYAKGLQLLHG
jgi:glycosyltransferase involved in cell wall biosynthesis